MQKVSRLALISASALLATIGFAGCSGDKADSAVKPSGTSSSASSEAVAGAPSTSPKESTSATESTAQKNNSKGAGDTATVDQACGSVSKAMQASSEEQTKIIADAIEKGGQSDLEKLAKNSAAALKKAADEAGNSKVKEAAYKAANAVDASASAFRDMPPASDTEATAAWQKKVQAESPKITEATRDIKALCPAVK